MEWMSRILRTLDRWAGGSVFLEDLLVGRKGSYFEVSAGQRPVSAVGGAHEQDAEGLPKVSAPRTAHEQA